MCTLSDAYLIPVVGRILTEEWMALQCVLYRMLTLNLRKQVLVILADMLYAASEVFKRAIDAIIRYGTSQYKSFFGNDEAADIKSVMQNYGYTKEQHLSIGTWLCDYADSRKPFDKMKRRHTYKEVADVANGAYDWKIKRGRGGVCF